MEEDRAIPVVDFSPWCLKSIPINGDKLTVQQKDCAYEMLDALTSVGGFILRNNDLNKDKV